MHLHFLIRTSAKFPRSVLASALEKYAKQDMVRLQHCERIESVPAITRYVLKLTNAARTGKKARLLFVKYLGVNKIGSFRGYFANPKCDLWEAWKRETFGQNAKQSPRSKGR